MVIDIKSLFFNGFWIPPSNLKIHIKEQIFIKYKIHYFSFKEYHSYKCEYVVKTCKHKINLSFKENILNYHKVLLFCTIIMLSLCIYHIHQKLNNYVSLLT